MAVAFLQVFAGQINQGGSFPYLHPFRQLPCERYHSGSGGYHRSVVALSRQNLSAHRNHLAERSRIDRFGHHPGGLRLGGRQADFIGMSGRFISVFMFIVSVRCFRFVVVTFCLMVVIVSGVAVTRA